jgi:hypothetical protein
MLNMRVDQLSKTSLHILAAAAVFAAPLAHLHAQSAELAGGPAGYQVACSIQDSSGMRACDNPPPASCNAEVSYASQPSTQSTAMTLVNHSEQPVKVYWLNFQGQRVLYDGNLAPNARHVQQTFIGHNWLVTTQAEQCVGIFGTFLQSDAPDITASAAPPIIPEDEQPAPPADNLAWTPGYWAWNDDIGDYYWVPGAWIAPPIVGYVWTPGYWDIQRGVYGWHPGYWGRHMGFYGGINYGFGYFGRGFVSGTWQNGRMVYEQPVVNNSTFARASFNGAGGVSAQPNTAELAAANEKHISPTAAQLQQVRKAHNNLAMRASINNGHPASAAISRLGDSSSPSLPSAHHAGTLSYVHSAAPPPAAGAGTASSHQLRPASTSPVAEIQNQSRAPQVQPHIAHAQVEQPSTPQDNPRPKQNPPPPKPAPHAGVHTP